MRKLIQIATFICVELPIGAIFVAGWGLNKLTGGIFGAGLDILSDLILKPAKSGWKELLLSREEKLYRAIREENFDRVRELVASNVNANGKKALWLAAQGNNPAIAAFLLKSGIDPNCRDESNYNALHVAADNFTSHKNTGIFNALVKGGVDPNALTAGRGLTPLHMLAIHRRNKALVELIKAGADINKKSDHGFTVLHMAAQQNDQETLSALIKAGADITATTPNGYTAEDLARSCRIRDNIVLLEEAAKRLSPKQKPGPRA